MESGGPDMDLAMSFLSPELDSGDDGSGGAAGVDDQGDEKIPKVLREQDRFLPIANVARIMKKCIPHTGKVAKDARECVQECISEFISFITSEASDRCHQEKRKTINGEDILWAMNTLGFENYVEPLKIYLQKFREANKCEKIPEAAENAYDLEFVGCSNAANSNNCASTSFASDQVTSQGDLICGAYNGQQNNQVQTHTFTL